MNKTIISVIVAVIIAGGAGFYGGLKYGQSKGPSFQNQQGRVGSAQGQMARRGGRAGGQFVNGSIISKDDNSITIKIVPDGGSKIVFLASSTSIGKMTQGTINDLVVGQNVMVGGVANNDGTVTAQTIQLRQNASSSIY